MGGWLSWRSALSHPERVSGLILIGASGPPHSEDQKLYLGARIMSTKFGRWLAPKFTPRSIIKSSMETTYFDQDLITPELIDRYWELLRYPGNRVAAGDRSITPRNPEVWNDVSNINVPVLLLWGEEDLVTPMSFAYEFNKKIKDTKLISYPNVRHIPMEEKPESVSSDISEWVSQKFTPQ